MPTLIYEPKLRLGKPAIDARCPRNGQAAGASAGHSITERNCQEAMDGVIEQREIAQRDSPSARPSRPRIVIIGAGFGGL
jgi:hypothetical protein